MLKDWCHDYYKGDVFPKHLSDEQVKYFKNKYKNIPEQFYTRTRLPVVRPDNVRAFLNVHRKLGIQWQFQEQMSGSGFMSAEAYFQGIATLFPVDLRYGWDMTCKEHLALLTEARSVCKPIFKWSSPDCSRWCAVTNAQDQTKVAADRQQQLPMLQWLHDDNAHQAKHGYGYGNENGLRSHIFTQSPLAKNEEIPGNKRRRTDGCQFGCKDSKGNPVEKAYRFDCNIPLSASIKRCTGHGTRQHGVLEGSKETGLSTVYMKQMVLALLKDICKFLRKFVNHANVSGPCHPANVCWTATTTSVSFTRLDTSARQPLEVSPGNYHVTPPQTLQFQPREWKALHTGIACSTQEPVKSQLHILHDDLRLLPGLSLLADNIQDPTHADLPITCDDVPQPVSLLLHNTSDKVITVDATVPCFNLEISHFWTCPKCKHGGDREHSRIPGKCKLAPKDPPPPASTPAPAPKQAPLPPDQPNPSPVADPEPLLDQDGQGDAILNQPRYEEPPQAQESSKTQQPAEPQHVPKRKEVKGHYFN